MKIKVPLWILVAIITVLISVSVFGMSRAPQEEPGGTVQGFRYLGAQCNDGLCVYFYSLNEMIFISHGHRSALTQVFEYDKSVGNLVPVKRWEVQQ